MLKVKPPEEAEKSNENRNAVSDNSSDGLRNFVRGWILRSMLIGFAFALSAMFFAPTRAFFRFIRDFEAVQMATELFQFAIVLTLIGLILQGLFYLLRSALRFLFSEDVNGTQEDHTGE